MKNKLKFTLAVLKNIAVITSLFIGIPMVVCLIAFGLSKLHILTAIGIIVFILITLVAIGIEIDNKNFGDF